MDRVILPSPTRIHAACTSSATASGRTATRHIDAVELRDRGKLKSYSYTYKYLDKNAGWRPIVRWDNGGQEPHVHRVVKT